MKCISYDPTYLLKVMIRTQTLMLLLENDPANLNFMVFCKNIINEVRSSHTRSKPYINHDIRYWYKKMLIFITTVLMISIHHFYVPANCRKEVYSDEIKLVMGGVSVHLNSERQQCN